MPRWSTQEIEEIATVRNRLRDLIEAAPPFPEVIGDRKIIRFLRGHDHNVDKVCELFAKFLKWRKENNVDDVRRNIVEGGMDHPLRFPKGELILSLIPALVMAPDACDSLGCPIVVEQYNFSPSEVFQQLTIQDYVIYMTYSLEYRQLILEQISEERERAALATLSPEQKEAVEYGVIAQSCVIRDLNGVGFDHLGAKGQEIIGTIISLASDNYPELMRKAFMINVPWVFHTVWYFIKGLLATRTVAKVGLFGTSFMDELAREIPRENLPGLIGGPYIGYQNYVSYPFDKDYFCEKPVEQVLSLAVVASPSEKAADMSATQPSSCTTSSGVDSGNGDLE